MFDNLVAFLADMHDMEWHIASFLYTYNGVHTAVSVEDTACFNPSNQWVICRLTFFDLDEQNRIFQTETTRQSFQANITDIRHFFKIQYAPNLRDFLDSFYAYFAEHTPRNVNRQPRHDEENAIKRTYEKLGENPYTNCYGILHNKNKGQRRPQNSDKALKYAPDIYEHYKNDTNISFCFHEGPAATLAEIVARAAEK